MVLKAIFLVMVGLAASVQSKYNVESESEMVLHFVWGMKGGTLGLQQGLLNDERIELPDNCFGDKEVSNDLFFITRFMSRDGNLWDAYNFAVDGKNIILNEANNCRYTSTISMLQNFCQSHDYEEDPSEYHFHPPEEDPEFSAEWNRQKQMRCTQSKMIENFYMRFFNFYGAYNRVTSYWRYLKNEDVKKNTNDVYLTMVAIGRDIGKSLRILFDFELTDETREQVVQHYYMV